MTAKEYLSQHKNLDKEITLKREQIQKLYANESGVLDADSAVLEYQFASDIKRLSQLKRDIQLTINSLDDSTQRIVLFEKYINLKQPEDIADEIPCDVRTVYRWLNDAVIALQAKHPALFEAANVNASPWGTKSIK